MPFCDSVTDDGYCDIELQLDDDSVFVPHPGPHHYVAFSDGKLKSGADPNAVYMPAGRSKTGTNQVTVQCPDCDYSVPIVGVSDMFNLALPKTVIAMMERQLHSAHPNHPMS